MKNKILSAVRSPLARVLQVAARFTRPLTMGVRAIVLDADGRVFLVRHSYVPGWHLPGGGIEPGETALESLARELAEEGHIRLSAPPVLHGLFFNERHARRDHVALYIVRDFEQTRPRGADWEILETGFFALEALPEATTAATRRRLAELAGAKIAERW